MNTKREPITAIRNMGPAMAELMAKAGIEDAETVRSLGADETYARLLAHGAKPHFMAYLALALGLQSRPCVNISPKEKEAFRRRFDAIKSRERPQLGPDAAALDALGVRL